MAAKKSYAWWLQAMVDFVNTNVELDTPAAVRLEIMNKYPGGDAGERPSEEAWPRIVRAHHQWRDLIGWMADHSDIPYQIEMQLDGVLVAHDGKFFFSVGGLQQALADVTVSVYDLSVTAGRIYHGDEKPDVPKLNFTLPAGSFVVFQILDDMKTTVFGRCEYCGNLFANTGPRTKKYCSTSCQNTAGTLRVRARKKAKKKAPE